MYGGNTVGVVVPAYNEEGFVGEVLEAMPSFVDRIYVIDDASTDGTWDEIQRYARLINQVTRQEVADGGTETDQRVVPIRHDENRGVGGAIKTGYLAARDDEIDVTAVMGGDGQMDPDDLDRIVDPVVEGRAAYARGNRLVSGEGLEDMPGIRLVGNVMLTFLTKVASGYWSLSDPQSGYTAISLNALETVDVEDMYEYYGYCNDLLVKLNVEDMRIVDVPIPANYGDETSHIDFSTYVVRVSGMLLGNFLWRLKENYVVRDFHPLVLLYALGVLGGLGSLVRLLRGRLQTDARAPASGDTLAALLVSGLLVILAMIFDREANEPLDAAELEATATQRETPTGRRRQ